MAFKKKIILLFVILVCTSSFAASAHAAKMFLSPSSGTFTVGSTFDVNIFLNTEGKPVNTVSAVLNFPADKMQLVSPTVSQSIISVWTAQPIFNNQTGLIKIVGGMPGGINVQSGLITTLTFRVKQVSDSAIVKFSDQSRVLANDGKGTDVLDGVQNGVYKLILPPPQGPIVTSQTHPDQSKWYANSNIILQWASTSPIERYSYILDQDPAGVPDDISEGTNTTVSYKNIDDGVHYFHIKSSRDGIWGGITSFSINIDSQPPAEFTPDFIPSGRTSSKNQIINFQTSDTYSGVSYYEIKTIPLSPSSLVPGNDNGFFIEATSPYQMNLDIGRYDIIVRAYDKAGNYRETTSRLSVVVPIFEIVNDQGVKVSGLFVIPWLWIWIIAAIIVGILLFILWQIERWHRDLDAQRKNKELPEDVKSKLEALNAYRKKYGNLMMLFIVIGALLFGPGVRAEQVPPTSLSVPFISSVSRHISNEEIFYVGGKTGEPRETVIIYLQNLQTGATLNQTTISDAKGDWFYRHSTFLEPGDYVLWTQGKLADQLSPPSSQVQITVQKTAIQFGASRFSYEAIYLFSMIGLIILVACLLLCILYQAWRGRKKHKLFWKEVMEAEESIRRGFAVVRRDIEAELALIKRANVSGEVSHEIKEKEIRLLEDLDSIQAHIAKEMWDVEQVENS
jgi:hypothetical protein